MLTEGCNRRNVAKHTIVVAHYFKRRNFLLYGPDWAGKERALLLINVRLCDAGHIDGSLQKATSYNRTDSAKKNMYVVSLHLSKRNHHKISHFLNLSKNIKLCDIV
jgi:hypothetical protein